MTRWKTTDFGELSIPFWSNQNNQVYSCMCGRCTELILYNPVWKLNESRTASNILTLFCKWTTQITRITWIVRHSDSVWRLTDVGRTFFSIQVMSGWEHDLVSRPVKARHKLKRLVTKRESLSSAVLCSLLQQWQLVNVMISVWPHGLFIHHQRQITTQGNKNYVH